jgi:hypothetical protein
MEKKEFLESILGEGAGYATIVTKDFSGNPTIQKFFSYPDELDEMVQYAEERSGEDLYFSPIKFYEERRIRENAKSVAVAYADADLCHPKHFRMPPSIVVQTSDDRWHAYWLLDTDYEPHRVAMLSKKIAYAHQEQGCDLSGWNPTKLLRIPGSKNTKYQPAQDVTAEASGLVYTIQELEQVYADVQVESPTEPLNEPMPKETPELIKILAKLPADNNIMTLYTEEPMPNADMSKMLWRLELELFRAGLSAEEVFAVARHAKCNKYHHPNRPKRLDPDGDLWREVLRAKASYLTPDTPEQAMAIQEEQAAVSHVQDDRVIDFLTREERNTVIACPTFIDKYVAWARKKTDGAIEYQIASAFTLLSAAFSDTGYGTPKYGKLGLNLWFMLLGETTLSRKSTSRQLMLRMLRAYEKYVGYQIDIGSNVTAEGLVKHLSGRDKMTSLFHRDEVQGMFKEFVTKTYMATAADQFTELYDGHVPVVIRSTGGTNARSAVQSDRAETNFIMYLMGITSKVSEILTVDYFRSGFLARFLYVVADAPERTFELEAVEQAPEEETVVAQDYEMENIVRSIYDSKLWWEKKGAPFPRPIRMTDEALSRFNKFKWDMGSFTEGHPNEDSIEPSRQRMALSIWKCAILLAMYDRSDEVEVRHVVIAIHYAEGWFRNLVRMAASISESEWAREVDSLEAFVVTKGGKVRYDEAYKRFSNKKKREFDEMLEALRSQGRMRVYVDNSRTVLETM